MSDLVEFLRARLEEDETAASVASSFSHYSPDRMLAEVEAKRELIAEHEHIPGDGINYTLAEQSRAEDVLKLLALPYAEHPDYRQEWALSNE